MAVTVKIYGIPAVIRRGVWNSKHPRLASLLTHFLDKRGAPVSFMDSDLYQAERAVRLLGGEIVSVTAEGTLPEGAIV